MKIINPYHFIKAHLFNSSESAVKLAKSSTNEKHMKFAENMLSLKNKNLDKNSKDYKKKLEKNHKLQSSLLASSFKRCKNRVPSNASLVKNAVEIHLFKKNVSSKLKELNLIDDPVFFNKLKAAILERKMMSEKSQ